MIFRNFKKGDTLIEVILAFSVFSAAMMGGLYLMNNGMARAQGTLQITMARNAMDEQAEALRYLNTKYLTARSLNRGGADPAITAWNSLPRVSSASQLNQCPSAASDYQAGSFVLNVRNLDNNSGLVSNSLVPAETYPRLNFNNSEDTNDIADATAGGWSDLTDSQGLWIEAVDGSSGNTRFVDFHIRACWTAPGRGAPTTLGTIVRLYVPTN